MTSHSKHVHLLIGPDLFTVGDLSLDGQVVNSHRIAIAETQSQLAPDRLLGGLPVVGVGRVAVLGKTWNFYATLAQYVDKVAGT